MKLKNPQKELHLKKNVRNKKTRNPGYEPGNHWVICDRCGIAVRAEDAMKTWDNLVVCPNDWEQRHPQDFVRGKQDDQAAKDPVRPEPSDTFVSVTRESATSTIPPATF